MYLLDLPVHVFLSSTVNLNSSSALLVFNMSNKKAGNYLGRATWAAIKLHDPKSYVAIKAHSHLKDVTRRYPGSICPDFTLENFIIWLTEHFGEACSYCGVRAEVIDHKIPFKLGGLHKADNLQMVCQDCNTAKWALPESLFLDLIKRIYKYRKLETL